MKNRRKSHSRPLDSTVDQSIRETLARCQQDLQQLQDRNGFLQRELTSQVQGRDQWRDECEVLDEQIIYFRTYAERLLALADATDRMMGAMAGPDAPVDHDLWLAVELVLADWKNDGVALDPPEVSLRARFEDWPITTNDAPVCCERCGDPILGSGTGTLRLLGRSLGEHAATCVGSP